MATWTQGNLSGDCQVGDIVVRDGHAAPWRVWRPGDGAALQSGVLAYLPHQDADYATIITEGPLPAGLEVLGDVHAALAAGLLSGISFDLAGGNE